MALIGSISGSLSGSLTTLGNGLSYIKAGSNVTISSGSLAGGEHQIVIAASAGSLTGIDDQSSSNDDQITIKDGEVVINEDSDDLDFRVESNGNANAFVVDGGANRILFLTGSSDKEVPSISAFFVSGGVSAATTAIGSVTDAGAHFGGDIIVSGNTYSVGSIMGSGFIAAATSVSASADVYVGAKIEHIGDADTCIRFNPDMITFKAGDVEFLRFTEDGSQDIFEVNLAEADVDFIVNNTNDEALAITATGVVFNEDGHATNDFRVESDNEDHAIFVDAGSDFVGINATAGERPGNAKFFVSGARGAAASTSPDNTHGSHFGGDVIVSGNVYNAGVLYNTTGLVSAATVTAQTNLLVGADLIHMGDTDTKIGFTADKVIHTVGNIEFMKFTEDDSQDSVIFNEGGVDIDFRVETADNANMLFMQGSTNQVYVGTATAAATDVLMFVSGNNNMSDRHNAKGAVTVFGGGVILSGSLLPGVDNSVDLGAATHRFANIYTADINLRNDRGNWTLIEEEAFISFRNNDTGKRYKMVMEEITGDGSYGPGNDGVL